MRAWTLLLLTSLASAQNVICIGDSITAGGTLEAVRWPTLLEWRLGPEAKVLNLGVGGATMMSQTDRPYLETPRWKAERESDADVAVIMLGTNDTVAKAPRRCWDQQHHLEEDVEALLAVVIEKHSPERILLCSPPPMFPTRGGLSEARAADLADRAPRIAELAQRYRDAVRDQPVEFVDLARALNAGQVTDGVHLTPFGAEALANHIASQLRSTRVAAHSFGEVAGTLGTYPSYGTVVAPHSAREGHPWVRSASPEQDLALLDEGFYVVSEDPAPSMGLEVKVDGTLPLPARVRAAIGFNPAALPTPSVEYRGGAGWHGDTWGQQVEKMRAFAEANQDLNLVFFGDSITQGLTGSRHRCTVAGGKRPIDRFENAISLGLSGDRTEHLLHRLDHGALAILDPEVIVLQIGVNNINRGHTGAELAEGLETLVAALVEKEPSSKILICGPFPCGVEPNDRRRASVEAAHKTNASLALKYPEHVTHLDLRPLFLDEDGRGNQNLRGDGIHITPSGVEAWMGAIEAALRDN